MNHRTTSNPIFRDKYFDITAENDCQMTVSGTVTRTSLLLMLAVLSAAFSWTRKYASLDDILSKIALFSMLGFGCCLFTCFKPLLAKYSAPLYAILEGLALGAISFLVEMEYHGDRIVIQAVALTFGVFSVMLFIYKTGIIKVNEKFTMVLFASTMGIAVVYLMSWV
ncbi:MAG: Bax inhibitor-1/YccA family protein, partial [Puniceicoccales bacterium]|nr:Bax inhibitor-1/YccA family protein [Puniceicoccales bacterium]